MQKPPEPEKPSAHGKLKKPIHNNQRNSILFQLADGFIPPGFLQKDIEEDGERHLVFATEEELDMLADAKAWFVDGTFKVNAKHFQTLIKYKIC